MREHLNTLNKKPEWYSIFFVLTLFNCILFIAKREAELTFWGFFASARFFSSGDDCGGWEGQERVDEARARLPLS